MHRHVFPMDNKNTNDCRELHEERAGGETPSSDTFLNQLQGWGGGERVLVVFID
jgi:hypothetical protein